MGYSYIRSGRICNANRDRIEYLERVVAELNELDDRDYERLAKNLIDEISKRLSEKRKLDAENSIHIDIVKSYFAGHPFNGYEWCAIRKDGLVEYGQDLGRDGGVIIGPDQSDYLEMLVKRYALVENTNIPFAKDIADMYSRHKQLVYVSIRAYTNGRPLNRYILTGMQNDEIERKDE